MVGECELLFPVSLGTKVKRAGHQIHIAAQFVMRSRVDGFLQRKDQMAHERETILNGTDVRLGVRLHDVFDPDDGFHTIRGPSVFLMMVLHRPTDPGHNGASRETQQDVMFVMITDGKGDGHHGHFPVVFFQQDPMGQPNLVGRIAIGGIEFQATPHCSATSSKNPSLPSSSCRFWLYTRCWKCSTTEVMPRPHWTGTPFKSSKATSMTSYSCCRTGRY